MKAYERFLEYVKIHTTSDPLKENNPTTLIQRVLGERLVKEMKDLGIKDAYIDDNCYCYGTIPSNTTDVCPTIGFIAHLDTSPDISGENVKPRLIENYDGNDVVLNKELEIVLRTSEYPELLERKGETLIVTDGTTLLGADDKAGIAEIMTLIEYLYSHNEVKHGTIKIAFTPDEEVGLGTKNFNLEQFKCDFAYTVDGGIEGSIDYENFNAASCNVTINGVNIHPGSAKNHMINSILVSQEFNSLLPSFSIPANTEKYEGFNHLNDINGNVEKTTMHYIIRNHDMALFNKQKDDFKNICEFLNKKYPANTVELEITDSYYNMYEYLKDKMEIVEIAKEATKMANVNVVISPIRGGTDGAQLTYKGLPCPNLGTGGSNFHGKYEYITVEAINRVVNILINIVKIVAK